MQSFRGERQPDRISIVGLICKRIPVLYPAVNDAEHLTFRLGLERRQFRPRPLGAQLIGRELLFVPLHLFLVVPKGEHIQELIEAQRPHICNVAHPPLVARGKPEATHIAARTIGPSFAQSAPAGELRGRPPARGRPAITALEDRIICRLQCHCHSFAPGDAATSCCPPYGSHSRLYELSPPRYSPIHSPFRSYRQIPASTRTEIVHHASIPWDDPTMPTGHSSPLSHIFRGLSCRMIAIN